MDIFELQEDNQMTCVSDLTYHQISLRFDYLWPISELSMEINQLIIYPPVVITTEISPLIDDFPSYKSPCLGDFPIATFDDRRVSIDGRWRRSFWNSWMMHPQRPRSGQSISHFCWHSKGHRDWVDGDLNICVKLRIIIDIIRYDIICDNLVMINDDEWQYHESWRYNDI